MQEHIKDITVFVTQPGLVSLIKLLNHLGVLRIRGKEEFNIVHNPIPEILLLTYHITTMNTIIKQWTLAIDGFTKEVTNQTHPSVMPGILRRIGVV